MRKHFFLLLSPLANALFQVDKTKFLHKYGQIQFRRPEKQYACPIVFKHKTTATLIQTTISEKVSIVNFLKRNHSIYFSICRSQQFYLFHLIINGIIFDSKSYILYYWKRKN